MILTDTGPLVALFDPKDRAHSRCVKRLQGVAQPLWTTVPVLTEAFHLLSPDSPGSERLMDFIAQRGITVFFLGEKPLERAFELMRQYADSRMEFADASLVVAAEVLNTRKVFTLDRTDFAVYRVRRRHRHYPFETIT